MTGKRVILNNGTILENAEAGYADGFLWIWFDGTMQQAAELFLDPANTSVITFQYGEMQDVYEGYTDCTVIKASADGTLSVCMTKGADNNV